MGMRCTPGECQEEKTATLRAFIGGLKKDPDSKQTGARPRERPHSKLVPSHARGKGGLALQPKAALSLQWCQLVERHGIRQFGIPLALGLRPFVGCILLVSQNLG